MYKRQTPPSTPTFPKEKPVETKPPEPRLFDDMKLDRTEEKKMARKKARENQQAQARTISLEREERQKNLPADAREGAVITKSGRLSQPPQRLGFTQDTRARSKTRSNPNKGVKFK